MLKITGATCLSKSKKYMKNAVFMNNSGINGTSGIEFDFGFTSNGVGLVVRW